VYCVCVVCCVLCVCEKNPIAFGSDMSAEAREPVDVVSICATERAFAAVRKNGSVVSCGNPG